MSLNESKSEDRQSRFELRTLLETSRLLIESQDPDFVLNNLLLITMGKLLIAKGMILIRQPANEHYIVSKSKGRGWFEEDTVVELKVDAKLLNEHVIYGEQHQALFDQLKVDKDSILFNLRTTNHHLGFLCLGPKGTKQPLSSREMEFIESLSIISSVAIANSRMFQELRKINRRLDRKVHDLNTLLELSKDFNLMVDQDEIAKVFKFAMLGQMLIRTFFFALDANGKKSMIASSGIKVPPSGDDCKELFGLDDVVNDIPETNSSFLIDNDINLVIGLRFQGEKIGVVGVGARATKEQYGPEEINFLQSLGNLALLTIQKSLLLDERIENRRMEEELNLAKDIQRGLLPDPLPEIEGMEIAAINISSRQVGGDYFDFVPTPDGGMVMAIADVTGKGVPASLLMANLQSMLHALAPIDITLSDATGSINTIIHENTPSDKFITFFWGKLSSDGTSFKYVNAGHNPPYLFRKGKKEPDLLDEGGPILGAMPTFMPYEDDVTDLQSGDLLVFYTDGVTEAMNPEKTEEYEEERLKDCIRKNRERSSEEIMQAIIDDIMDFSDNIQYDDITIIVIKVS
ncbi:SpoIIE family protein phosphatase [Balneola sp. MJW-20]|uniref:GAF domain-containing SpoIIE family protein phosphatase n=1 Tax=Gracilimonas aurantiaca TaxID=3234185 RepID=UPI003466F19A